jgi:ferredoxin
LAMRVSLPYQYKSARKRTRRRWRETQNSHTWEAIDTRLNAVQSGEDLSFLKERVRAIQGRLDRLDRRIRGIQEVPSPILYPARVDPEKCLGCGVCEDSCPVGVISVNQTAHIDPERCIGCGRCVNGCPQGAITLGLKNSCSKVGRGPRRQIEPCSSIRGKRRVSNAHL